MILLLIGLASAQEALDADGDGLSAAEERHFRTDPLDADTDSDGILDGIEAPMGLDPMRPDTDGDGRPDGLEVIQGTDPRVIDALPEPPLVPVPPPLARVESPEVAVVVPPPPTARAPLERVVRREGSARPALFALALLALLSSHPARWIRRLARRTRHTVARSLYGILRRGDTPRP